MNSIIKQKEDGAHCSSLTRNFKDSYSFSFLVIARDGSGSIQANTQFFLAFMIQQKLAQLEIR